MLESVTAGEEFDVGGSAHSGKVRQSLDLSSHVFCKQTLNPTAGRCAESAEFASPFGSLLSTSLVDISRAHSPHARTMSQSYTCLTCRLRSIVQRHSSVRLGQQRWVSQAGEWRQDLQTAAPDQRRNDDASWRTNQRSRQPPLHQNGSGSRGRYSGQPLGPEQLLHELQSTPNEPQRSRPQRPIKQDRPAQDSSRISKRPASNRLTSSDLEPQLWKLRGQLFACRGDVREDAEFSRKLQDTMAHYRGHENAQTLASESSFGYGYGDWAMRILQRAVESRLNPGQAKATGTSGKESVTPYQALSYWLSFGVPPGPIFPRMMWDLARRTAEYRISNPGSAEALQPEVIENIHDLMGMWNVLMGHNLRRSDADPLQSSVEASTDDWSFLPEPAAFEETLRHRSIQNRSRRALSLLTPSMYRPGSNQQPIYDLESCAILTLDLLRQVESQRGGEEVISSYERWMRLIELSLEGLTISFVPRLLSKRITELEGSDARRAHYLALLQKWSLDGQATAQQGPEMSRSDESMRIRGRQNHILGVMDSGDDPLANPVEPTEPGNGGIDRFVYLCQKRLGRAVEGDHLTGAKHVLNDVSEFKAKNADVQIPQTLYEILIYSFLRLKALSTALPIWNEMVAAGYQPRVKSYTVMMRASAYLEDLTALEHFWNKMRQDKVQPDATAWSTRINILFAKKHFKEGLAALAEMGNDWLGAAKRQWMYEHPPQGRKQQESNVDISQLVARFSGDINDIPKPGIYHMNSAVTALARGNDSLVPKVVAWGRSFGIEPDIYTYNSFIHVCMRRGQAEEALKLLERMRDKNIQADSATLLLILQDMFAGGFLEGLSSKEQETKIVGFLSAFADSDSMSLNQRGYALVLNQLVKNYNNHAAAQAVLTYMISKGLEPSKHIYTILMDSHFQQDPPNFDAAETLWQHIISTKSGWGANLDSRFFDRVIKNYARHHEIVGTEKALSFLDLMDREGKRPSWGTLEIVARMLVETEQWGRLAQMVDRTRRRTREVAGLGENTPHEWKFWSFVISTGLLREEGVVRPEQLMGAMSEEAHQRR